MTAWNLFEAVILNTLTFMIGADPIDLKRTTTFDQILSPSRSTWHSMKLVSSPFDPSFCLYVSRASRADILADEAANVRSGISLGDFDQT